MEDIRNYGRGLLLAAAYVLAGILLDIPVCPMVWMTGLPCPGCGMTRAAVLFLQGHWKAAWQMHPFFYVLLALAAWAFILRYIMGRGIAAMRGGVIAAAALAVAFYVYRMIMVFPGRAPMVYESHNGLEILEKFLFTH